MQSVQKVPYSVLVVDDQDFILSLYKKILLDLGVSRVETAYSAKSGLREFMVFRPQLVLVDYQMPGTNGLGLLRKIREVDDDAYVVMLTGVSKRETVLKCLQAGAKSYLLKTDELGQVKNRLLQIFSKMDLSRSKFAKETAAWT